MDKAKGGPAAGDVLAEWRQGESHGLIRTPLDLQYLEIEFAPRGAIELLGSRAGANQSWTLPATNWHIEAKVDVGPAHPIDELIRTKKHAEAGQALWDLQSKTGITDSERAWFRYQAGVEYGLGRLGDRSAEAYRAATALLDERPELKAVVLRSLGESLARRNQVKEAEEAIRGAIESARRAGVDSLVEANAYYALAATLSQRRQLADQLEALQRARAIVERLAPNSLTEATILNGLGIVEKNREHIDEAEVYLRRAVRIREQIDPDDLALASVNMNLAATLVRRGDLEQAQRFAERAEQVQSRFAPVSTGLAQTLNQLTVILRQRGQLAEAERTIKRALEIDLKIGNPLMIAGDYHNLGNLWRVKRDPLRARTYYEQALALREKNQPEPEPISAILTGLGNAARDLGDLNAAHDYHSRALSLREKMVPAPEIDLATTLVNLASIEADRHELDRAQTLTTQAYELFQRVVPNSLFSAATLFQQGEIAILKGDSGRAEDVLERALAIRERLAPGSSEHAEALERLSAAARLGNRPDVAISYLSRATNALESQAPSVGVSETSRADFRAKYIQWYRDLACMLVDQHKTEQAFEVIERARGRSILNLIAERDLVYSGEIPAEIDQARRRNFAAFDALQARLKSLNPETAKEQVAALAKRRVLLELERDDLREQIIARSPRLAALQYPRALNAADSCASLDPGEAMVAFSVSEARVDAFVLTPGRTPCISAVPLKLKRRELEESIGSLRDKIVRKADPQARASELYRMLLAPLEGQIQSARRIVISPDGPLHTVPWAALRRPDGRHLVQWKPTRVALSMTLYAQLKKDRQKRTYRTDVVAFGDPAYAPDQRARDQEIATSRGTMFWPLPYSRREVEGVAKLFDGRSTVYLQDDATEARAKNLKNARYLHFAAHGLLDATQPLDSAIVLVKGEGAGNGLLQAWEIIEQVRWDSELVVLSACESALGTELGGEGLIGLTRAVQYAGARSVLASLWNADDRGTSDLMLSFYKHLKAGEDKDVALRAAQLEALRAPGSGHPYYWAGFILNGDSR